jgi:hypothetical protein
MVSPEVAAGRGVDLCGNADFIGGFADAALYDVLNVEFAPNAFSVHRGTPIPLLHFWRIRTHVLEETFNGRR